MPISIEKTPSSKLSRKHGSAFAHSRTPVHFARKTPLEGTATVARLGYRSPTQADAPAENFWNALSSFRPGSSAADGRRCVPRAPNPDCSASFCVRTGGKPESTKSQTGATDEPSASSPSMRLWEQSSTVITLRIHPTHAPLRRRFLRASCEWLPRRQTAPPPRTISPR